MENETKEKSIHEKRYEFLRNALKANLASRQENERQWYMECMLELIFNRVASADKYISPKDAEAFVNAAFEYRAICDMLGVGK